MKIQFWGVQGSIPNPLSNEHLQKKIKEVLRRAQKENLPTDSDIENFLNTLPFPLTQTTGGNTTCFEVISEQGARLIIDMGSGARKLGLQLMKEGFDQGGKTISVLMTHTHLDHIMGFPFFMPAYTSGNKIIFYGGHPHIKEALIRQAHPQSFPVQFEEIDAEMEFHLLKEKEEYRIDDFTVACKRLEHPGGSYAYRITEGGKSLVIATDAEYKDLDEEYLRPFIEFYQGADLLVFEAQYTLKDVFQKVDWGHSSSFIGVDIGLMANVAKLALTHYDPAYSDDKMIDILKKTEAFKTEAIKQNLTDSKGKKLEVLMAYEGLEIEV